MYDSAKYLIHADIEASGVVERSDVVGAIFGQTEGLLGDELDIRDLQESGRLGRIEVEVDSEGGRSFGTITIASGLDRVETAILAAALESIERVGPCRADVEVTDLEDARTAKRRSIVDRATDLLAEFDEASLTGRDIVEEVRKSVRVEDVTEFHGLPAGPRVTESDAIVVVEGRSDVLALLEFGVKNAIAVEGTNVPDAVAELTRERTVTAFLDGDRGGDLILKELAQVGEIDYVALAPPDRSVEDLARTEALSALRQKVPFEAVDESDEVTATADGSPRAVTAEDEAVESAQPVAEARQERAETAEEATEDAAGDGVAEEATGRPADGGSEEAAPQDGTVATGVDADGAVEEPPTANDSSGATDVTTSGDATTTGDAPSAGDAVKETGTEVASDGAGAGAAPPPTDVAGVDTADSSSADATTQHRVDAADSAPADTADPSSADAAGPSAVDAAGTPAVDDTAASQSDVVPDEAASTDAKSAGDAAAADTAPEDREPETLADHVEAVVGGETGLARALDGEWDVVDERPADDAFALVESPADPPSALVVDSALSQRVLDVAAQRGVEQVVCAAEGEYVKQPTDVRVRTAADL